jgi:hypothetical protein
MDKKFKWLYLNRIVNKRRLNYNHLKNGLRKLLNSNIIPIRVFHSVSEWLAPHDIDKNPHSMWIKNSGFIPFENDESLEISILTAKLLKDRLDGEKYFVYSGNKSIHVWWDKFNFEDFVELNELEYYSSARKREKSERKARIKAHNIFQSQIPHTLDYRSSTDPRRIVPIINSLNCFTGRITKQLSAKELMSCTADSIRESSEIPNWQANE